ncbi:hypothetical protein GALMADRAFT_227085 [Galerina marginata CBS 339.88]|uniref:NB-ARC domain-containing protein n=1 Tax=Galerina marginata (strain CBS 339.88) TaxID=685588 RepID=A0A067SZI4_GALM3|nr:hypothetical protein GALMADRAFT_227085 [Galerina marginata CBS 339.88]
MEPRLITNGDVLGWRKLGAFSAIVDLGKQLAEHVPSLRWHAPNSWYSSAPKSFPTPKKIYGRDDCITQIVNKIHDHVSPLTILGPPGVGKSSVAVAVLHDTRIFSRFAHRRHWVHLSKVTTLNNFFDILCDTLSVEADGHDIGFSQPLFSRVSSQDRLSSIINTFRATTSTRFIILNDFEDMWDAHRNFIEPILEELSRIPHLTLLITMRGAVVLPTAQWQFNVPTLSPRDAKRLFIAVYPVPDATLDGLLEMLDYLPLAIVLVAHSCQTRGITPSVLSERWKQGHTPLLEFEDENPNALDASIGSSMNSIAVRNSPHATRLLQILTMLPAGIMADDLFAIAPSISNVDNIARMLTNMSLTSVKYGKRISLLSPVRSYLLKYHHLEDESRKELYLYHFKLAEEGLRHPGDCLFPISIKRLLDNQLNIEAILTDALQDGCIPAIEATLQYSSPRCAIKPRIDILVQAVDAAKKNEAGRPVEFAREDGSMSLTARCLQRLGEMKLAAGNYAVYEHFSEAVERYEKLNDRLAVAYCGISMAHTTWINNPTKGIYELEEVRQELMVLKSTSGQAKCDLKLSALYLDKGEIEDARAACNRALSMSDDPYDRALCRKLLSSVLFAEGQLDFARSTLDEALSTLRDFGDRSAVADCLRTLSSLHLHAKRQDEARATLREAIEELKWLGRDLDVAFSQWKLGEFSEDEEAVHLYQLAIPQFWASVFTFAGAECRLDLGLRYMHMGSFHDALLNLEIARPELQANITPHLAAYCLVNIIDCLCSLNNIEAAKLTLETNKDEIRAHFLEEHGRLAIEDGQLEYKED